MIQYQILEINITRTKWQTVRRITKEILGVKRLIENFLCDDVEKNLLRGISAFSELKILKDTMISVSLSKS